MKNIDRKIIFETMTGSHLFGTNRPDSDKDYMGIFLPATSDLLGIFNCPKEWTENEKYSTGDRNSAGDIDRKYYSLPRYLSLLAEGQSNQLEMLFSSPKTWTQPWTIINDSWLKILANKNIFLAKTSLLPLIGFAVAQSHKSILKGENLNKIHTLIGKLEDFFQNDPNTRYNRIEQHISHDDSIDKDECAFMGVVLSIESSSHESGTIMPQIVIAGRKFEFSVQLRHVLQKIKKLEEKYGNRAISAAENGLDYKSLMHTYRLLHQAKMLLNEGELRFPLDEATVAFLATVRDGSYKTDYFQEIEDKLTELRELKEKSSLPERVDRGKVNQLCQEILHEHIVGL